RPVATRLTRGSTPLCISGVCMAHSSRGLRRHTLNVETRGSSPLCATRHEARSSWGVRLAARTLGFHPNSRSSTLLHPTRLHRELSRYHGRLAQLDRAPLSQGGSSGFESLAVHQGPMGNACVAQMARAHSW